MTNRSWVRQIMGMPISVHIRHATPDADAVLAAVFGELDEVDRLFSTYRRDSEISRLARGELGRAACSPVVRDVLQLCDDARERTDGFFDVQLPGGLDPSGLVKGWAAERAASHLRALPSRGHYLNAGGDLAVHTPSALLPWWRIGIEDPRAAGELLGVLPIASGGVATSGSARRGAHIVDPHTGEHPDALLSVTVTGPSLMWADVYATAAFARGAGALEWLAAIPRYDALTVTADGTVAMTDGMRDRWVSRSAVTS